MRKEVDEVVNEVVNKVSLRNVSKVYNVGEKEYRALDHVDLDIEEGKLVVILGPSGAGKSTLLNLIGGMDTPSEGEVIVNGENITGYSENKLSDFRAKSVGFIFQFYNILPSLTVRENVELINEIVKDHLDAAEALEDVGLSEHMYKFPNQLSGGEQQRVSIARAIAKNPALLLCDEPTGALDSQTGVMILKILKKQTTKERGNNTVIIVTHNALIADIADVVIRVKNGRIKSVEKNLKPVNIDEVQW
ncbi:MAG: ABC transporter ATP-binding protein [Acetatifactor sp.]|nr:ABC transporter ATP-binding protein [Acetatifactor sp.]